jgi:PAS domain S-box-containing protein
MGHKKIIRLFENLSIKKKVLYSTLIMFVLIGILSSLAYWIIFIPAITQQIQGHSLRVGQSLVTRCRTHILSSDRAELSGIVFQKKWIEKDISYIFVVDAEDRILAHTFIPSIPEGIERANLIKSSEDKKIKLISVRGESIYDAAVPVKEGLKTIGTVHIGVGKKPVDSLTLRIGIIFVAVMVIIILLASLLSNLLANYISRPLLGLTRAMNDLCMGRINQLPQFPERLKCWEVLDCEEKRCPAFQNRDVVCWFVDGTLCPGQKEPSFPEKLEECYRCDVYKKLGGDEIIQLSHSFSNIIYTLQLKALEIRRSEEKYRVLFHDSPNPLFVVDMKEAKILDVNKTAIEIYQYTRDELMKMTLLDLIDMEDTKRFWKEVQNSHHQGFFFLPRLWARKKDGHHFFIDLHARVGQFHETEKGTTAPSWIIRTVDITERLEQESQLIQAGKMATLGEMATGIAHELNQPLNVIKVGADFFVKMIQRGNEIPEEHLLKVSRNVSEQVDRATDIINHLRDFGRKIDFKQYPLDINESIRDVFTLLGEQLRVRDIEVKLNLDENLPKIMANKNPLEQIFLNLVTNARDTMESKGKDNNKELTISTFQEKDKVVALVSDTGTGIPTDILEKIFEPFFTTKEVGKGTGLGLSITYNLIRDFEGEIEVESTSDKGTTFRITFPIHRNKDNNDGETLTD